MAQQKKGGAKKVNKKKSAAMQKKTKKIWFTVKAPESLNSVDIGDITAYEPNALLGRTIETTLRAITGSMRDMSNKFKLRIVKVQGETVVTEPILFYMQNSHVQRIERRAKQRIITIVDTATKDKQKIRVKLYILLNNKVARAVRTTLQQTATTLTSDFVGKREYKDLFGPLTAKNISNDLKKALKPIYPSQVIVWKIKKVE
jgi:small subunit ribosomal protein S3Ae